MKPFSAAAVSGVLMLVSGTDGFFNVPDGAKIKVSNITVVANSPGKAYSLLRNPTTEMVVFEVRDGDVAPAGGCRSEFVAVGYEWENGVEYWVSDSLYIDPASGIVPFVNGHFNLLGQLHHTPGVGDADAGPPLEWDLRAGPKFHLILRTSLEAPLTRDPPRADIVQIDVAFGTWIHRVQHFKMDPMGAGFWRAWINGVQVLNYSGPTGYVTDTGPHWQWGSYRSDSATPTAPLKAWYANVEAGETNLSSRIKSPLPIPPFGPQ
jgi:hypothetical protein